MTLSFILNHLTLYSLYYGMHVYDGYLDEAHADGAHPGELVDSLEALVHRLGQQGSKLLVVEDLQVAAYRTVRQPLPSKHNE